MITEGINYFDIYKLFNDLTPLPVDCGQLCGAVCCRAEGDGQNGMLLFPGEVAMTEGTGFRVIGGEEALSREEPAVRLLICEGAGRCRRDSRPLACRIFPLFPHMDEAGRIRVIYDPRAWRVCPLVQAQEAVRLSPAFVRAVRQAGRRIARSEQGRAFLRQQSQEMDALGRLLPLDQQRAPICRRVMKHRK